MKDIVTQMSMIINKDFTRTKTRSVTFSLTERVPPLLIHWFSSIYADSRSINTVASARVAA